VIPTTSSTRHYTVWSVWTVWTRLKTPALRRQPSSHRRTLADPLIPPPQLEVTAARDPLPVAGTL